jgi:wobble nucleotide-excising tRNase
MKWITKIELNNYRAFSGTGSIEIPFQKHALIYGENGSGKTSFYLALKDFLHASENRSSGFILNKFEEDIENKLGWIKIKLKNEDDENEHTFSSSKADTDNHQPEFILANKSGGFLDYKKLLKVYALDAPEGNPPNFFHFIVNV